VVDGAWAPALFTVDDLDGPSPRAADRSALAAGVGGPALSAASTDRRHQGALQAQIITR
jgi:hypothetical protein